MKTKPIPTWIVVADASTAKFFLMADHTGMENAAPAMVSKVQPHARDVKSDRPGRGFVSANGASRHAFEPPHDYHKLQKHDFAQDVTRFLEQSYDDHQFERLVLVAPDRLLGELRKLLPHKMQKCVWHAFPHDYVKLTQEEIWAHISPQLKEHVQPG